MPNIKVEPTIPNYPPQGIQAQLDLLYLWNPDVANDLIDQINKALEDLDKDLTLYLTKAEAAATYATQTEVASKVSKSGDTMTGALTFVSGSNSVGFSVSRLGALNFSFNNGSTTWYLNENSFASNSLSDELSLGTNSQPFPRIYAQSIGQHTATLIDIPNVAGTMTVNEVNFKTAITDTNKGLTEADAYTKEEVDAKVSSVYRFRGSVAAYNNLPTEGNVQGDVWNVEDTGANYAWDGTKWDKLSETIDLTPYLTKEDAASTYATITTVDGKQDALTAGQLAAVNSGITAEHVDNYDAYADEISTAQSTADKADGAAEVAQQTANLAGQNAAQALSGLTGKVNIAQGAENAGKVMTVDEDGNLVPADASSSFLPDQTVSGNKFLFTTGRELVWKSAISEDEAGTIAQDKVLWFGNSAAGIGTSTNGGFGLYYYGNMLLGFDSTGICLVPMNGFQDLGDSYSKFNCVYTTQLNNGAGIAIPTTGGTMALLSDIPDISNLATKTEVQQEIQDAIGTIETALAEV